MSLKPPAFTTPYVVLRPTPFQHISPFTPDGEPNDDGVLQTGSVVWSHHLIPRVSGYRTVLGFVESAGEILVDVASLAPISPLPATATAKQPTTR